MQNRAVDLFCGAGGSSWGAKNAGVEIVAGFDKWDLAGRVYKDNFPDAGFISGDLELHDPKLLKKKLGKIDLMMASPECTNHSPAKGSAHRCEKSKETAFHVTRFAETLYPRWIIIENVISMRRWKRYNEFLARLTEIGYHYREQVIDSSYFNVPQARRRLFILCDRIQMPPEIRNQSNDVKNILHIINKNGKYAFSPLITENRAQATIDRADRAIEALGDNEEFLIVYYGSDSAGGWQALDRPLRTITTIDRFAYVRPTPIGYEMRMLQPEELKLAMGWPKRFRIERGNRRQKIQMIGNAVCPKVMRSVVHQLTSKNIIRG